jgi:hypothetical protein
MKELINKEITVIVDGLQRPCGGILVALDNDYLVIETNTGNTIRIPERKISSILTKTQHGGTNEREQSIR